MARTAFLRRTRSRMRVDEMSTRRHGDDPNREVHFDTLPAGCGPGSGKSRPARPIPGSRPAPSTQQTRPTGLLRSPAPGTTPDEPPSGLAAYRRCTTRLPRSSSRSHSSNPGSSRMVAATIRRRTSADVTGQPVLWGGIDAGTHNIRSRQAASTTFPATTEWPRWGGSKVPPKTPTRGPPSMPSVAPAPEERGF